MSWSVSYMGTSEEVVAQLDGATFEGQSKLEYDEAAPTLKELVKAHAGLIVTLTASGHGTNDGEIATYRAINVNLSASARQSNE